MCKNSATVQYTSEERERETTKIHFQFKRFSGQLLIRMHLYQKETKLLKLLVIIH